MRGGLKKKRRKALTRCGWAGRPTALGVPVCNHHLLSLQDLVESSDSSGATSSTSDAPTKHAKPPSQRAQAALKPASAPKSASAPKPPSARSKSKPKYSKVRKGSQRPLPPNGTDSFRCACLLPQNINGSEDEEEATKAAVEKQKKQEKTAAEKAAARAAQDAMLMTAMVASGRGAPTAPVHSTAHATPPVPVVAKVRTFLV